MEHWGHTAEVKDAARVQRRIDDKTLEREGMSESMTSDHLHRYWFHCEEGPGYGVTAYTREEAEELARGAAFRMGKSFLITGVTEDVAISDLDQDHVTPYMSPPEFHGVWFPR